MKNKNLYKSSIIEILIPDTSTKLIIPILSNKIKAGFPSPADDYVEEKLDLNKYLIPNKSTTFFARVTGNSMIGANIYDGDLLIVDKSLKPNNKSILICSIHGEFTIKRVKRIIKGKTALQPDNPSHPVIVVEDTEGVEIWGVVTYTIHKHD